MTKTNNEFMVGTNEMPEIVERNIDDLNLWENNPRTVKDVDFDRLIEQIKLLGVYKPLLINQDNIVLGGNMRTQALRKMGVKKTLCSLVKTDNKAQMMEYALSDNDQIGVTDEQAVAEYITHNPSIRSELFAINSSPMKLVSSVLNELGPDSEEDEAPELDQSTPPISKIGEIYQLGSHRLMCGDSTDLEQVTKLMDNKKADMVLTDPPYGMLLDTNYSGMHKASSFGKGGKDYEKVIGDNEDFRPELITSIFDNFDYCKEIFLWGADYYRWLIPAGGGWLVWDKRGGDTGMDLDKLLGSAFELCWSLKSHKRDIARVLWSGHHGMQKSDQKSRTHPTEKPTELARWFLERWGKETKIVVDVYLGSGSTLIACEQTDRTCYGMELDPKYCDVIRKRYAKLKDSENWEQSWQTMTPKV